jgi:hypothetical protein
MRPTGTSDSDFIQAGDLPYLTVCPLFPRRILPLAFHDGKGFHAYVPQADASLMDVYPLELAQGHYLAGAAANVTDVEDKFFTLVAQQFSYPKVIEIAYAIHADITNALTSIQRYFVLLEYANRYVDLTSSQMVLTEIEYSFANHRACYDLFNGLIALFRFRPQYAAAKLPTSFRVTIQKSTDELASKFGVPESIVTFMRDRERRFSLLRAIRDGIFHRGLSVTDSIFRLDDGFAIHATSDLADRLSDLGLWPKELLRNESLASVLPLIASLAEDLLLSSGELMECVRLAIPPPDPIAGACRCYLRSPLATHIRALAEYQTKHWIKPDSILSLTERRSATATLP